MQASRTQKRDEADVRYSFEKQWLAVSAAAG
jgi:hypothetical protein